MKLKRPLRGGEKGGDVLAVQRALNRWATPAVAIPVSSVYDRTTSDRMVAFQLEQQIRPASGDMGQRSLDALWPFMDTYGRMRYRMFQVPSPVPDLGPVTPGGKSVLEHDLTHATGGLDRYPAFDEPFGAGEPIIAPEPLRVYKASSARRRDGNPNGKAFYARGTSKIKWWIGHTDSVPPISKRARLTGGRMGPVIPKGTVLTETSANHEAPHGHIGINTDDLIGHELIHHTDYTHGAPLIGTQLEAALL